LWCPLLLLGVRKVGLLHGPAGIDFYSAWKTVAVRAV
jgi:hypothetical protein